MPLPIPEALEAHDAMAVAKAEQVRSTPTRYLLSSMLAGAFVGFAVVLLVSTSAPLLAAGSPFAKLVQGVVFGLALTLVVFAGAELFTGNNMVMLQARFRDKVRTGDVAAVWGASLVGNFIGSLGLAAIVHAGGLTTGPFAEAVAGIAAAKDGLTGGQLFARAVLCNALVCLAIWMATRAASDSAKLVVLWWALLAFIASGFEHSVANMTTLSLAALSGSADWSVLARNLAWTIPGNIVGGGLVIGLAYGWLGTPSRATAPVPVDESEVVAGPVPVPTPAA
jgi:nitrite transporter NirC